MLLQITAFHSLYNGVVCHCVYTHICLSQSSVDGHLGCFHILVIVHHAAMNFRVRVSLQIRVFIFSRYMPRSGVLGHMIVLFLAF